MSVALLGLLLLQFYWIRNVHQLTQDRFNDKVQMVLEKTVTDLEKIEMQPWLKKEMFERGLQGTYADYVNAEFGEIMQVDESIQIRDTVITKDGERYQFLVISGSTLDTTTGLLAEHRVITKKLGDIMPADLETPVFQFQDTNSYAIHVSNSFNRQIIRKAHFLDEMMVKMFAGNYFDDITLRLSPVILDSLLSRNLLHYQLDTNYNFSVVSKNGKLPEFSIFPKKWKNSLTASNYSMTLYPNDIVTGDFELLLEFPGQKAFVWKEMTGTLFASLLLVLIIVFAFYLSVSTIYKQKQLSEIKNDFISNMTHELKTPISTISLACEAIQDPDVAKDGDTLVGFVGMIDQENKRLGKLVENVLQTALLDKGKMSLKRSNVRIDQLVKEVVDAFQIRFKKKAGAIRLEHLDQFEFEVDRIHFSNVIYNLLDNALKYCNVAPEVSLKLMQTRGGFNLTVRDNGIGIKKEDQKRIFEKLYRVPTGDVHDVKGFGLGLNYVEAIVQLHNGQISVDSTVGKGSTFEIQIENE